MAGLVTGSIFECTLRDGSVTDPSMYPAVAQKSASSPEEASERERRGGLCGVQEDPLN